jgi:prophage regulatory protein
MDKTTDKPVSAPDAILRLPEVERMSGLRRSAIYERMAEGRFPQSIPLGGRLVGWLESEIQEWIRELAASRSKAA